MGISGHIFFEKILLNYIVKIYRLWL